MYTTYPQPQNYGPQHTGYGYAPMPQQPMPMQQMPVQQMAPVAQSATASKGLLMIAGLAVVGAAAFGGVYLMNSSEAEPTAASTPSTVFNIPSEINIPSLTTEQQDDPASPVIVNNPAPSVRVFTPSPRAAQPGQRPGSGSVAGARSRPCSGTHPRPAPPERPAPRERPARPTARRRRR